MKKPSVLKVRKILYVILGSITGEALDLSVVDDPIKGRAEAQSEVTREKTPDWLTDDVLSRFSEIAGSALQAQ